MRNRDRPLAVGITGGIGSGKSEVARQFQRLGARVLSADLLAREMIDSDPAIRRKIVADFGSDAYRADGPLDRAWMARRVFRKGRLKKRLNDIVHPAVIAEIERRLHGRSHEPAGALMFVEAALIVDAGVERIFDYTLVVDAPRETRITRVMRRDHLPRRDVEARIRAQLPARLLRERADFIIENEGSAADLRTTCKFLFALLTALAAGR